MMATVSLPIFGGSHQSRSPLFSSARAVNCYYVPAQAVGLSDGFLIGTEGISQVATAGNFNFIGRGSHNKGGIPYFVQGEKLVRLNSDMTITVLGDIPGDGRVSMADNGAQLMILNELGDGYIWDDATLQQIVAPGFTANGTPKKVVYKDGYFICSTSEKKFIASDIDDGMDWNALYFSRADGDPDVIVSPLTFKGLLYMFGAITTEGFQNVGGADFPFAKIPGFILNKGLAFPFCIVSTSDYMVWVGQGQNETPAVWASTGNDIQKISTDAEDSIIRAQILLEGAENSFAFQYSLDGAYFAGFSFPTKTLIYDFVSKRWHERESIDVDNLPLRWRVNSIVQAYGNIYASDSEDGRIGNLSASVFDEYSSPINSYWITQPFVNMNAPIFCPSLEVVCEAGVGNTSGSDPQIGMARSQDGRVFTDTRVRSLGKIGQTKRRTIFRRNGRVDRFEIFKFSCSDKCKKVFISLTADIR